MNDNIYVRAQCPFFLKYGKIKRYHYIECEPFYEEKKLGFAVQQRSFFERKEEYQDFAEIFCCDMYETCPVFKAILRNREEEDAKKHIEEKKNWKI